MSAADVPRPVGAIDRERAELDAGPAAWLAVVPTAAITLIVMLALGPALGDALFPNPSLRFWEQIAQRYVRREPTEQARFLIALLAAPLLVALTVLLTRRAPPIRPRVTRGLVVALQLVAALALLACLVAQRLYTFPSDYAETSTTEYVAHVVYFTVPTLAVAAAIAAAIAFGVRSARVRARVAAWSGESRGRRIGATLVVLVTIAITLLPAIRSDSSIFGVDHEFGYHLQFPFDEAMAVLDGRSPLGDFAAQYSSLWPYVTAAAMALLGSSLGVFTLLMAGLTGVALLALFGVLRRLTRSSPLAAALFLPLLATSAYRLHGPAVDRFSLVNYFGTLPLRYAGPFLLAWLTARQLDGARPRRAWVLFLAGGLVALDNANFGVAALLATLAALLWAGGRPTAAGLRRVAFEAGVGLAGAFALVTAVLLLRTGSAPDFSLLFRYARIFALGGFSMVPMRPLVGLSTAIYLTYLAAIGVATVRALRREPDRLLTGLLVWSGVFGLGAGSYYAGRSIPEVLTNMFPAWALALTLLTLLVVRQLNRAPRRRPLALELVCLFGFGLLVCSLAQTPAPWSQIERIQRSGPRVFAPPTGQRFVARHTRRGEHVVILMLLGHRIGANLGVENVSPYTGSQSIQTEEQLDDALRALRDAGGREVFLRSDDTFAELTLALERQGFARRALERRDGVELWIRG